MLVLTRREGETVIIRDKASGLEVGRVKVAWIRGDRIRIGFEFPRSLAVNREEVDQKIQAELIAQEQAHVQRTEEASVEAQGVGGGAPGEAAAGSEPQACP